MSTWVPIKILEPRLTLYSAPDRSSETVAEITDQPAGEITAGPGGFLRLKLRDGRYGYVDGKIAVHQIKELIMRQEPTSLYESAGASSPVVATLGKGARVTTTGGLSEGSDGLKWVPVATTNGQRGFIRADTQVTVTAKSRRVTQGRDEAVRQMKRGAITCAIGIAVTAGTYAMVSDGGGSYVVAWGAILFGGFRFLTGLFHYSKSEPDA